MRQVNSIFQMYDQSLNTWSAFLPLLLPCYIFTGVRLDKKMEHRCHFCARAYENLLSYVGVRNCLHHRAGWWRGIYFTPCAAFTQRQIVTSYSLSLSISMKRVQPPSVQIPTARHTLY